MRDLRRWMAWLAGLWAGVLWCIALLAAPAVFAALGRVDAGRVVGIVFAREAGLSLAFGVLMLLAARRHTRDHGGPVWTAAALLPLVALFCTVAGYYALLPAMEQARAGQGGWSFGALHAASSGFYAVKTLAVSVLAFRLGRPGVSAPSSS